MSMTILICDDSTLARKALARHIQTNFHAQFLFAANGREALQHISEHNIDVLFLDLTMPVMDGFEVLQSLPVNPYPTNVVVVSADIQKEAVERCRALGATDFLPKPFNPECVCALLNAFGVVSKRYDDTTLSFHQTVDYLSAFKEVSNIALGRGAAIISDHFGEYIQLPFPHVANMEPGELAMAINEIKADDSAVIAQRFVGGGIHGEALVCLKGKDIYTFGDRLGFSQVDEYKNEIIIDIANLMVSSFLVSLSEQLSVPFSLRQPIVLEESMGRNGGICQLSDTSKSFFTVEYTYVAKVIDLRCEVLFLMDADSIEVIKQIMRNLH